MSKFKFVDYTTAGHTQYAATGPRVIEKVSVIYLNGKVIVMINGREVNVPADVTGFVMDIEV